MINHSVSGIKALYMCLQLLEPVIQSFWQMEQHMTIRGYPAKRALSATRKHGG